MAGVEIGMRSGIEGGGGISRVGVKIRGVGAGRERTIGLLSLWSLTNRTVRGCLESVDPDLGVLVGSIVKNLLELLIDIREEVLWHPAVTCLRIKDDKSVMVCT